MHYRKPHVCGDGPRTETKCICANVKTPRMWGWTVRGAWWLGKHAENPTYVGMDRFARQKYMRPDRKPHVCGDGPLVSMGGSDNAFENPTYVGMDRLLLSLRRRFLRKPHVCGDGPFKNYRNEVQFVENPTYVGMDRALLSVSTVTERKPHVCGDGPGDGFAGVERRKKTPRMWGWTAFRALGHETYSENPTYVGMDRHIPTSS